MADAELAGDREVRLLIYQAGAGFVELCGVTCECLCSGPLVDAAVIDRLSQVLADGLTTQYLAIERLIHGLAKALRLE